MKSCQVWIISVLILTSCFNRDKGLRMLSPSEVYKRDIQNVNRGKKQDINIPLYNEQGRPISSDSVSLEEMESLAIFSFVNEDDSIVQQRLLPKTKEWIEYQVKWDSILTGDSEFLERFLALIDTDIVTKNDIRKSYRYMKIENAPLPVMEIDCNNVSELLNDALQKDQIVRDGSIENLQRDRENQSVLINILTSCGHKIIEDSGVDAIKAAFMIVQHADKKMRMEQFHLFEMWCNKGLIEKSSLALMIDRKLIDENKKQLFGTQVRIYSDNTYELLPIENPSKLDFRRDSVGLGPIEDYLVKFGIPRSK